MPKTTIVSPVMNIILGRALSLGIEFVRWFVIVPFNTLS